MSDEPRDIRAIAASLQHVLTEVDSIVVVTNEGGKQVVRTMDALVSLQHMIDPETEASELTLTITLKPEGET